MALLYLGGEAVPTSLQLPQALAGTFQGLLVFCLLGCDLFVNYRVGAVRPSITPFERPKDMINQVSNLASSAVIAAIPLMFGRGRTRRRKNPACSISASKG